LPARAFSPRGHPTVERALSDAGVLGGDVGVVAGPYRGQDLLLDLRGKLRRAAALDRAVIAHLTKALRHLAGNFYINDKPTGAVAGQQPFGGGRASGTNDKAGSVLNLLRWTSQRAIKENFIPATRWEYAYLGEE
jgi:hypothetical protein